ncbi:hypothetical protein SCYAM73S_03928 [Streptomyces cyaneofuscatus]
MQDQRLANGHASNAPFALSFNGASNVTPRPTSLAWATTSCAGPSHTPTRQASKRPEQAPDRQPHDQRHAPAPPQRNTASALTDSEAPAPAA